MNLQWETSARRGYAVEVAEIGRFTATLVCGGAGTIGANVWVGTFAGEVVAISATRAEAIRAIEVAALRMLLEAGAALGKRSET
jgi:hypothetical protein